MKHKILFIAAAIVLVPFGTARGQNPASIVDTVFTLQEKVITSLRVNRKIMETPASVIVTPVVSFQKQAALTVSNVLAAEPGIAFGGDGIWSTNANVRGFGENRLITLIDGDRVETATDLTASLSMIDVNDVERVEVIKGAQSSLYGTGAMGGIINIITKDGRFAEKPYFDGAFNSSFAGVNRYFSNNLSLGTGSRKWYVRVTGTLGDAQNIRTPKGVMANSQFTTANMAVKLGFKPLDNHLLKLQYQNNQSYNVGIPGGASFPGPALAKYAQIGRQLLDASYEIRQLTDKFTSLKVSYFYQDNNRDVQVQPNTVTTTKLPNGNTQMVTPTLMTPGSKHLTHSAQLQTVFDFSDRNTFIAGADFFQRHLTTDRTKYITAKVLNSKGEVLKTNQIERGETPIPTSTAATAGVYFQDEARFLDNRLTATLGGRVDGIWMQNEACYDVDYIITNGNLANPPAGQRLTFEAGKAFDFSWSANLGLLYRVAAHTDLVFNASRSYRAPSLEERFKYIDLGNYVRLGNPQLKPEDGLSADFGVRVWGNRFTLQSAVFVNRINNMIVETPGTFESLPALVNANVSKARLYGADLKAEYHPIPRWVFSLSGAYVRGRDIVEETNLPLMPPLNGRLAARYTFPQWGTLELNLIGVARQHQIAEGETATDGYGRLDFAVYTKRFSMGKVCAVQGFAGVENITNTAYTNHLSTNRGSVSVEPGRNVYLRLNLTF